MPCAVGQRRVDEVAHFVRPRDPHRRRPRTRLYDVEERHARLLRGPPDHRQIEEVAAGIPVFGELVMVVAHQRRSDDIEVLPEVLPVRRDRVPFGPELLVVGVGREEIDVGQVPRVAPAEVSDQLSQTGKRRCAGLVGNEVAVEAGWLRTRAIRASSFCRCAGLSSDAGESSPSWSCARRPCRRATSNSFSVHQTRFHPPSAICRATASVIGGPAQ